MAMTAETHGDDCHQDSIPADTASCLSQPALECATDDLIFDSHDPWKKDFTAPLAMTMPNASAPAVASVAAGAAYFGRAPPADGPPINVRHCVYLK